MRALLSLGVLCLLVPGVVCEQEIVYPEFAGSSDLRLIYWNGMEDCIQKVRSMLSNVTAFCKGDESPAQPRILSCQDITSNLMKVLHFEQDQSTNCRGQLNVTRSLLESLRQQLSELKEGLRGILGIGIRYQGDRTSLSDLLNRNHEELLRNVDSMLQDIHDWKHDLMNHVTYRISEECDARLQICNEGLMDKMNDLTSCRDRVKYLENAAMPDVRNLRIDLNATLEKLLNCELDKGKLNARLEDELKEKKQWNDTSAFFIDRYNRCDEKLHSEEGKLKLYEDELEEAKQKLEICNISLNAETTKRQKCYTQMIGFQQGIINQSTFLKTKLTSLQSVQTGPGDLLDDIDTSYIKVKDAVSELLSKLKSKSEELESCMLEKSNIDALLKNCRSESTSIESYKLESQKRIFELETALSSCYGEAKELRDRYTALERQLAFANTDLQKDIAALNAEKQELVRQFTALQQRTQSFQQILKEKDETINDLRRDKEELNKQIRAITKTSSNCVKEKEQLLDQLKSKTESVLMYSKELNEEREKYRNYTIQCQKDRQENVRLTQQHQENLARDLSTAREENARLRREKQSLESQKENLRKEVGTLKVSLTSVSEESQKCLQERASFTETLALKDGRIRDLERQIASMNLTSKLTHINLITRTSDLELKLRYLDYLLKSNRNEIKMLQEYAVILLMLVNNNADILSFLKEAVNIEGEGFSQAADGALEALLRRLVRSIQEHHSRIYAQMLQMKPYMDKVVPLRIRRQVQRGRTPNVALLAAAKQGNATETDILLDVGADVNFQDNKGLTPLHWAARHGHADVVELLLSRGAEPDVHAPALGNKVPLHLAAEYGHPEAAEVLLDFGSNIEARALDHATPLLYAANNGHEEVVSVLLKRGADIRSTNAYHKSALDLAAKFPSVTHVIHRYMYGSY